MRLERRGDAAHSHRVHPFIRLAAAVAIAQVVVARIARSKLILCINEAGST
jgi:hypothetical protein